jgi:hypothetical protein
MNNVHSALVMAAQKTAITEACNHVYAAGGRFFSGKIPFSSSQAAGIVHCSDIERTGAEECALMTLARFGGFDPQLLCRVCLYHSEVTRISACRASSSENTTRDVATQHKFATSVSLSQQCAPVPFTASIR